MRLLNIYTHKLEDEVDIRQALQLQDQDARKKGLSQQMVGTKLNGVHPVPLPARSEMRYIILSHVWMDPGSNYENEILFDEVADPLNWSRKPLGAAKIKGACEVARKWCKANNTDIKYIWIDSCCIDQKNPVELSAAINSMYRWYQQAEVCFVYLSDVRASNHKTIDLSQCKWFTRGWTLQELIGSPVAEFYDADWRSIGSKAGLKDHLNHITGISEAILFDSRNVTQASVAHRMSWVSTRSTRREEDQAYCLMGLFDVQMPVFYGEGLKSAFRRLQEEILKYSDDHSIFAWLAPQIIEVTQQSPPSMFDAPSVLAPYPHCFKQTGMYTYTPDKSNMQPYMLTNRGLQIRLSLQSIKASRYVACLDCQVDHQHLLGIYLEPVPGKPMQFRRVEPHRFCRVQSDCRAGLQTIFIQHHVI